MIRAALISIAFLGITLTLILMQPTDQSPDEARLPSPVEEEAALSAVTRAETSFEALSAVTEPVEVTVPVPAPAPEPTTVSIPLTLQPETTADTLPSPDLAPEPTPSVSASLTGQLATPSSPLEQLIVTALNQGQSEAYIDALINDAAQKGKVEVPDTLITTDGRVDTVSLLAVLSQPATPEIRSYTVEPGDSLASIAYRFYGSTNMAVDIFAANRDVLKSPNHVEVGQTLVIPAL